MSNASSEAAGRLYRIMDFSRVVQIFEKNELYFAHPSTWDDPYEQRVLHQNSHALFAQCWCSLGVSDAMWRIYSPHHMGVRIATSTRKLRLAIRSKAEARGYKSALSAVRYLSQHNLEREARVIAKSLESDFKMSEAVQLLYMKREAFQHESEWRATVFCPEEDPHDPKKGIAIEVEPHKLIDNILLDPRAPQELVDAFQYYFKEKLRFRKKVRRSVLYKTPRRIEIVD